MKISIFPLILTLQKWQTSCILYNLYDLGKLNIIVMEAKNLKKMDVGGLSGIISNKTGIYVCIMLHLQGAQSPPPPWTSEIYGFQEFSGPKGC